MNKTLPTRAEIPEQYTWDLSTIYPTNAAWEEEFAALPALIDKFTAYQGRLADDGKTLLAAMTLQDTLSRRLDRLIIYAFLRRDEDTANATYQSLADRVQQLAVRTQAATSFVRPELLSLPDGALDRLMDEEPGLRVYAHDFEDLLRGKPHVLPQAEEQLLAQVGELASAPSTVFSMLNNADLTFGTVTDEEGSETELTLGRYQRFMRAKNRALRADAFMKLHGAYTAHRNSIAALYSANVKKNLFYARTRKYPSALEAALHPDNIPPSVYTNLIEAVHDRTDLMERYLTLRRRVLGLDELHMYDLHVPLVADLSDEVVYEDARKQVLAALQPLGAEYGQAAQTGLNSRWVDVYETPNKRSGAYSWGAYDTSPFILLNYQDTLNDMFTLAHELGHTMHSYFTRRTQPYTYGNYTIFVAEVASTLNEALLTHYLLQNTPDPRRRLAILNNQLDTIRGTLYRQTMFAEFEKLTHEAAEAGEALTAERLSEIYYDLNKRYHGAGTVSDEVIAIEWARIPHFYSSFYVYKYATGIAAATALAKQIVDEGQPAVDRYLRFLSRGSSAYSIDLLRDAGVDMTSPEPVKQALDVFAGHLAEMEQLLTETGALAPEESKA